MKASTVAPKPPTGEFTYPILCFTRDGDIWAVRTSFELTTCGPQTLADGVQLGMDLVDAAGASWRVISVTHVGYAPFSWRSIFRPPLRLVEHVLEPGPAAALGDVKERVCGSLDAFPEYWCELADKDTVLEGIKAEVRAAQSIAAVHDVLGLDYFGY